MNPVTDAVLLIEGGAGATHVRNTTSIFITHVEQHAFEFLIGVEAQRPVGAVKVQRDVGKLLPPFRLLHHSTHTKIMSSIN